jgi:hypothetical protein
LEKIVENMCETDFYQIIKENYLGKRADYVELFKIVKSMTDKIGLDKALELLGRREEELREAWLNKNLAKFERSVDIFEDVARARSCVMGSYGYW